MAVRMPEFDVLKAETPTQASLRRGRALRRESLKRRLAEAEDKLRRIREIIGCDSCDGYDRDDF